MHERQAIREAMIAQLVGVAPAFRTQARARVFKSREAPMRLAELPAINIYVDSELITPGSEATSPRELKRVVVMAVEGWVSASENVDDALDDLALEIEAAMDVDTFLGDTAFDSVLVSTEMGIKPTGDRPMGCVHLEYAITFHSQVRSEVPAAIFDTASARLSIAGEQATADQSSTLTTDINQEP
jgi:hypothetical protein